MRGTLTGPSPRPPERPGWMTPTPTREPGATGGRTRTATATPNSSSWSGKRTEPPSAALTRTGRGLAVNSLWSSASNAAALGGNVLSRLSAPRLTDRHARNLWGMGLGDFARQRSRGGVDGYDYNGGGYSVGADSGMGGGRRHLGDRLRAALRPCQKPGLPGAQHAGHPDGLPVLGPPDGRKQQGVLDLQGSLTWAETRNNMTSRLGGAPASTGKWNNETWLAQAEVSRTADCAGGWRLTPFVRMESRTAGRTPSGNREGMAVTSEGGAETPVHSRGPGNRQDGRMEGEAVGAVAARVLCGGTC